MEFMTNAKTHQDGGPSAAPAQERPVPATALPWCGTTTLSCASFIVNSTGKKTVANSVAEPEDAAYIVRAANAFPALVEALVAFVRSAEDGGVSGADLGAIALEKARKALEGAR